MSYDFALFIPDYGVDGIAVGSRYLPENKHLMERYNMEDVPDPSAAGPLADIAEAMNSQVQELEENGVLLSSDIALEGGRMLPIPVTYPSAEVAKNWLSELAVNNSLGLIDASSNLVITFGDEDPRFETITAYLSIPGFSRRGLPSLLEYVRDMLDENHFVILQRKDADQNYIQTIVDEDAKQPDAWHVEYRAGSYDQHFALDVDSKDEVVELFNQWLDGSPEFTQHGWENMGFTK